MTNGADIRRPRVGNGWPEGRDGRHRDRRRPNRDADRGAGHREDPHGRRTGVLSESIELKCGGGRVTSNKALLLIVCGSNPFVPTSYGPNPDPYPPRWVPERQTSRQSSQRCSTSCPTWSRHRPLSLNRHASVSSTRFPNFSRTSPSLSQ